MITDTHIENWFSYHKPDAEDMKKYELLREKAKELAYLILSLSPSSADQTDSIRKLREVIMTVNASIACKGN